MQVTETLAEGLKHEFQISVPASDLDAKADAKLVDLKDKVRINGFRPGKVPVSHLKKVYGRSVMAETIDQTIRDTNSQIFTERGFRLATYAMWWIRASIQEYILRSWSLVKMGTTASQKKLFFNLRKAKSRISAFDEGDLRDEQVATIATKLGVPKQDVIDMNRRLGGDASLNAPLREDGEGEWQDWLVDERADQESSLADREESDARISALHTALRVLNPRERRIFEARRLVDEPVTLEELSTEFGVSRERVRQIEVRAFEKVQAAVKADLAKTQLPRARATAALPPP